MSEYKKNICSIVDMLAAEMLHDIESKNVSITEMSAVADIIKDLAEAHEKLSKVSDEIPHI